MSRGRRVLLLGAGLALALVASAAAGEPYRGPLLDAHSHLPNLQVLDAYVEAMARHGVRKVLLLGVGGAQKQDAAWIAQAARRHPERVLQGAPVPDPLGRGEADRLDALLGSGRYRAAGEVHLRQASRRIDRPADDPAFGAVLEVAGRHGVPVVVHLELTPAAARALERALEARRSATLVLAHAGSAEPGVLAALLARHPNLLADLSGMHFLRTPRLAGEKGPLDPGWKALIERMPERFLWGIDVWAPSLFEPAMLDRLMGWSRRVLGELGPEVAPQVGYRNAARLLKVE